MTTRVGSRYPPYRKREPLAPREGVPLGDVIADLWGPRSGTNEEGVTCGDVSDDLEVDIGKIKDEIVSRIDVTPHHHRNVGVQRLPWICSGDTHVLGASSASVLDDRVDRLGAVIHQPGRRVPSVGTTKPLRGIAV
jgi:hypothetical protein